MSSQNTVSIAALAALMLAPSAYAMPMSGTMTGHIEKQDVQPRWRDQARDHGDGLGHECESRQPLDGAQL